MSDDRYMKGHTLQGGTPGKLALAELKSVQWIRNQQMVMDAQRAVAKRYNYFRRLIFIGWGLLLMEIIVVWWWTFIHNISWPGFVLSIIDRFDSAFVYVLDMVQHRLDWWWDIAGVRLMWFRESVENFLDRNLTVIDYYFAIAQDWVSALFSFVSKPIRVIGNGASAFISQKPGQRTTSTQQRNNGSLRRNSEGYEAEDNEDFGDEDYLSDASMDSRRLMKENSRGELRQANGGAAHSPVRRILPGALSKMGQGNRTPGPYPDSSGRDERATLPREAPSPRTGSQRGLARFFTSSSERKAESAYAVNEVGKSSPPRPEPKWYEQSPPAKPRGSPAILRASAASPPTSPADSPAGSPEGRRRGFGRFSLKRQRPRK